MKLSTIIKIQASEVDISDELFSEETTYRNAWIPSPLQNTETLYNVETLDDERERKIKELRLDLKKNVIKVNKQIKTKQRKGLSSMITDSRTATIRDSFQSKSIVQEFIDFSNAQPSPSLVASVDKPPLDALYQLKIKKKQNQMDFSSYIRNKAASTIDHYKDVDIDVSLDYKQIKELRQSQKPVYKTQKVTPKSNTGLKRYVQTNYQSINALCDQIQSPRQVTPPKRQSKVVKIDNETNLSYENYLQFESFRYERDLLDSPSLQSRYVHQQLRLNSIRKSQDYQKIFFKRIFLHPLFSPPDEPFVQQTLPDITFAKKKALQQRPPTQADNTQKRKALRKTIRQIDQMRASGKRPPVLAYQHYLQNQS